MCPIPNENESESTDSVLEQAIEDHLGALWNECKSWKIGRSSNGGRGIFALRDIDVNEVIFVDPPLIVSPIGGPNEPFVCVNCYTKVQVTSLCRENCGLPVCDNCLRSKDHQNECDILRSWAPKGSGKINYKTVNCLTAVRALLLNDSGRHLLNLLQSNRLGEGKFIECLSKEYDQFPDDQEILMTIELAIAVKNTNAFKTLLTCETENNISVMGLYPLTGLLNHKCIPNTRHSVDENLIGKVCASTKISKGDEIVCTYSQILWNTQSRMAHLAVTKDFMCFCERCSDPTESGTYLTALKCQNKECLGQLLPVDPLNLKSPWKCGNCSMLLEYKRILIMQEVLTGILKQRVAPHNSATDILRFIRERLHTFLPLTNQYAIELKLAVIWRLDCDDKVQADLDALHEKKKYCEEVIDILNKLNTGESSLKGFICYELFKCLIKIKMLSGEKPMPTLAGQKILENCCTILEGNIAAPKDLTELKRSYLF